MVSLVHRTGGSPVHRTEGSLVHRTEGYLFGPLLPVPCDLIFYSLPGGRQRERNTEFGISADNPVIHKEGKNKIRSYDVEELPRILLVVWDIFV